MDDNIRVHPSYPCRSVFSSGASDRLTRRRGEKERRSRKVCASRATASHAEATSSGRGTPCPNTRRQKRALRATRQTPTIPDKTHQHHPCSSVVSVSIRGLFRRVTISAPIRVLFLAHVTRQARVPSPVTGIRTPKLPLRPVWEKGVGGMRGKGRRRPPAAPPRNGCVTLVA